MKPSLVPFRPTLISGLHVRLTLALLYAAPSDVVPSQSLFAAGWQTHTP